VIRTQIDLVAEDSHKGSDKHVRASSTPRAETYVWIRDTPRMKSVLAAGLRSQSSFEFVRQVADDDRDVSNPELVGQEAPCSSRESEFHTDLEHYLRNVTRAWICTDATNPAAGIKAFVTNSESTWNRQAKIHLCETSAPWDQ